MAVGSQIADAGDSSEGSGGVPRLTQRQFYIRVLGLFMVLMNEAIGAQMLFPVAGLLLAKVDHEPVEASGFRSGLLIALFQFGQILCCKQWGEVSDFIGRKPVMQFGLFCASVCTLCFGFSTTFAALVVFRFLQGFFNANAGVAKTVVAEITVGYPDLEAKGFSMMGMTWGVGACVGLTFGGLLYDPVKNPFFTARWPSVFYPGSVWDDHPALLPCACLFTYGILTNLVAIITLRESNINAMSIRSGLKAFVKRKFFRSQSQRAAAAVLATNRMSTSTKKKMVNNNPGSSSHADDEDKVMMIPSVDVDTIDEEENQSILDTDANPSHAKRAVVAPASHPSPASLSPRPVSSEDNDGGEVVEVAPRPTKDAEDEDDSAVGDFKYSDCFKPGALRTSLATYMLLAAGDITATETIPLWMVTHRELGGLNYDSSEIGVSFMMGALGVVTGNLTLPLFRRCLSKSQHYRVAIILSTLFTVAVPFVTWFPLPEGYWFYVVCALLFCRSSCTSWCYTLTFIAISHASPKGSLGAVNGAAHSSGCLVRLVFSIVATPMYAWTVVRQRPFPLDDHFVFLLVALINLFTLMAAWGLYYRDEHEPAGTTTIDAVDEELEDMPAGH